MPTPPLPQYKRDEVLRLKALGKTHREIAALVGCGVGTVSALTMGCVPPAQQETKRIANFSWREAVDAAVVMQQLKKTASWSQDYAEYRLGNGTRPVILTTFCDTHIGAYGANYELFRDLTDEILATDNLYVALLGDILEMAIKLRGVLEVTSQVLTPEMQEAFLDSWLEEIEHKVAFAVWDNHSVMRSESQSGVSLTKNTLARRCIYHNGIGHNDALVGEQRYRIAASHKFLGGSMFNRTHAQGRYARHEAPDREIVLMGDIHTWGISQLTEGGLDRVYITGGTLHENSGYAKRFFSLRTSPHYPCVVMLPDKHEFVPFKTIQQALRFIGQ